MRLTNIIIWRKNGNLKKLITLLLAVLLSTLHLVSCNESTPDTNIPADIKTSIVPELTDETEETEAPYPEAVLPDKQYGGVDFDVMARGNSTVGYYSCELHSEEETGEVINDLVYRRNMEIEEQFDIDIKEFVSSSPIDDMTKLINAQDDTYNFFAENLQAIGSMAVSKYLLDFKTIPYVDIDKPWWDKAAMDSCSLFGTNYAGISDLIINDKQRAFITIVSKDVMEKYNLEIPYDIAREGKWTFDKMVTMSEIAVDDLDGNGIMDDKDQYGIITEFYGGVAAFASFGGTLVEYDEDDNIVISLYNERNQTMIDNFVSIMKDSSKNALTNLFRDGNGAVFYSMGIELMKESRVMFVLGMISWVQRVIQESEAYPAILPMPKYDETQTSYITPIQVYHANTLGVPSYLKGEKFELTGVVLEAMSAFSGKYIYPEFLNDVAKSRYAIDPNTTEMIDIAFSNIRYDLGTIFDWGFTILNNQIWNSKQGLASIYKSQEKVIEASIKKITAVIKE